MTDYTRTYSSEELALEREMAEMGENRHYARVNSCREAQRMSLTIGGRALMRKSITPVAEYLQAWASTTIEGPGKLHAAAPYLARIGYEVAAMLAVQTVVDGLHQPRSVTFLAGSIGKSLETEWRMREMSRNNPGIWKEALDRTKGANASSKQKRTFMIGRYHGILPGVWPRKDKVVVGFNERRLREVLGL